MFPWRGRYLYFWYNFNFSGKFKLKLYQKIAKGLIQIDGSLRFCLQGHLAQPHNYNTWVQINPSDREVNFSIS